MNRWKRARARLCDRYIVEFYDSDLSELTPNVAQFLNWAFGHRGFMAKAGLWFQPPFYVEHREQDVRVHHVNERIVELPFAFGHARKLRRGGLVLDVGAAESVLSLAMASAGLSVIALDPRGYRLRHPNLEVVEQTVESWGGPKGPLDAIFAVSTLEHIGLNAYGQGTTQAEAADAAALRRFREWLAHDGLLVLTVPFGTSAVDDFERVYSSSDMARLLAGWNVIEHEFAVQMDAHIWEVVGELPDLDGHRAVALVAATPITN